jgi:hypothetical protein
MKAVSFPNKHLIELINKEGFVFVGDEKGKSLLLNPIENSAIHILLLEIHFGGFKIIRCIF